VAIVMNNPIDRDSGI